jgi:hypothetical protein
MYKGLPLTVQKEQISSMESWFSSENSGRDGYHQWNLGSMMKIVASRERDILPFTMQKGLPLTIQNEQISSMESWFRSEDSDRDRYHQWSLGSVMKMVACDATH